MNNMTIENANAYKKQFLKLLGSGPIAEFDISSVETMDLSGVQLLIGLYRECIRKNIELRLTGNLSPVIREHIKMMGLSDGSCSSGSDVIMLIKSMTEI